MRVGIDHRTRYRFSQEQARLVQLLRLSPADTVDQTVVNWHIGVSCDVRLRAALDGYGNRVTMLYADGPIADIEIHVTGEVLTAGEAGIVRGTAEPLPCELYLRETPRTVADAAIAAFANGAFTGTDPVARLHALNLSVGRVVGCAEEGVDQGRTAAEVFALDTASPRDVTHLFLAAARSVGVPSRYVSGYRASDCGTVSAPHAWVETHVDGLGWIAFDPCHGISADARYVRVAVALDASGAAPVSGSRTGQGVEMLDVDLEVTPVEE